MMMVMMDDDDVRDISDVQKNFVILILIRGFLKRYALINPHFTYLRIYLLTYLLTY